MTPSKFRRGLPIWSGAVGHVIPRPKGPFSRKVTGARTFTILDP